jgi:hypothetical protein
MSENFVEIKEFRIPVEKVISLTPHQRYTYYLLGHVFNELMSLQKLIGFAIPKHEDETPARIRAENAQLFFLFRLAASKLFEFERVLNKKEFRISLEELVFITSPELKGKLREFNKAMGNAAWLGRMRNGMGFHYPNFLEWESYTTPDSTWIDDVIYVGSETGNTFYDASATVAMHWMFDKYRDFDVGDSVVPLADEIVELIKNGNNLVEALVATIAIIAAPDSRPLPAGKILAPEHDMITIPYWTHMSHMKS